MKPKLYSYVRFSSVKQREGNSLERQQDTVLNRHGFNRHLRVI